MNNAVFNTKYIAEHFDDYMSQIDANKETAEEIAEALKERKTYLQKIIAYAAKEIKAVNVLIYQASVEPDMIKDWAMSSYCLIDVILDDEDLLFDYCNSVERENFEIATMCLRSAESLIRQLQGEKSNE